LKRNIVTAIIFSILTCGIYTLVWTVSLNNEVQRMNGEPEDGISVLLLSILTCGIYYLIWNYRMGQRIERAGGRNEGVIYLLLAVFQLGLVSLALMQTAYNDLVDRSLNSNRYY
jgi:hypothetical protein